MEESKKTNKGVLIGVIALVCVAVIVAIVYFVARPKTQEGSKAITIDVVNKAGDSKVYTLKTDAEFLRGAMDEAEGLTYDGSESEYGFYVESVNGEVADYSVDGSYWSIYVNGEYGMYGIDQQVVTDGDAFKLVYETYTAD